MCTLEDLPADQQAVLELLLRRHRTYDEIAVPLRMDRAAVRERAQAAVASLAADTAQAPSPELRASITDWLLRQEDDAATEAIRAVLATSMPARAWARGAAARLEALADEALPELPPPAPSVPAVPAHGSPSFDVAAVLGRARTLPERLAPLPARLRTLVPEDRSARIGAGLLAAGVVAVLVLAVALLSGGGDGGAGGQAEATIGRLPTGGHEAALASTRRDSDASGVATVLRRGDLQVIGVMANGLPRSTSRAGYDVWLSTGTRDGAVLAALMTTDAQGRIRTLVGLPRGVDPARFTDVLVSRQRVPAAGDPPPQAPGLVVLRGTLADD